MTVPATPARKERAKREESEAATGWLAAKARAIRILEETDDPEERRAAIEAEALAQARKEEAKRVERRARREKYGWTTDEGPPWGPGPFDEEMEHICAALEGETDLKGQLVIWRQAIRLMNWAKVAKKKGNIDRSELKRTKKVYERIEKLYKTKIKRE